MITIIIRRISFNMIMCGKVHQYGRLGRLAESCFQYTLCICRKFSNNLKSINKENFNPRFDFIFAGKPAFGQDGSASSHIHLKWKFLEMSHLVIFHCVWRKKEEKQIKIGELKRSFVFYKTKTTCVSFIVCSAIFTLFDCKNTV